ncbi:hypothetical protein [Desulfatibacillum aliphaticivorans]|uniref:hypothetical protein n=1 Tax=Desulfatibacillum aliphaticivorans TaxID=218208 RepID=UPI0003FFE64E|nr:hypothetical protein [Desulfatibacillum aliphaticivorans]
MKRVIIYHDDADGKCAAAIAARHKLSKDLDVDCIPMQYGDPVPWEIFEDFTRDVDELWMLDFSLDSDRMEKMIHETGMYFTWVDHHKTALDSMGEQFAHVAGIRSIEKAACLLTWEYCNPESIAPQAVVLVADRDIWAFEQGDMTRYFYESLIAQEHDPDAKIWDRLLLPGMSAWNMISGMVVEGEGFRRSRMVMLEGMAKRLGRSEDLDGTTCLCVNYPGSGDLGQIILDMGYDVAHCYVEEMQDGRLVRTHSVYSDTEDVSVIASVRGGGGHKGAAGWTQIMEG